MTQSSDPVVYRWPRHRLIRPLGRLVLGLGLLWLFASVLAAATDAAGRGLYLGLGVASLLILALAAARFAVPPAVLELSEEGYRVFNVRARGAASAHWSDVTSVSTGESVAGPVLVLEGRGRAPSVVPLVLLGAQAPDAQDRVRALLEAAHRTPPA